MTAVVPAAVESPWRGRHGRTTVGVFSLAFLFAFEALAVATVMPDIADELDGLRWYAVAFAAPLAAAVVALPVTGAAVDRLGPGPALRGGLVVFCLGVVLAGLAPSMPLFLLGRLVHGYGGGVLGVALYVLIAQAYPERLRPQVFAVLTMGWVLPALVGPVVAAWVAATVGWRWVFLGVPVLAVAAWLLVADAPSRAGTSRPRPARLPFALLAAGGVLLVSVAGQRTLPLWPLLVAAGLAAIVAGGGRLLPPRVWTLRAGLPAVLGTRAAVGTAFAAAEVYLPLLLTLERGLTLTQAGWVLTVGALTWSGGAVLAARWPLLADQPGRVRLGAALLALGIGGFALVSVAAVPLVVPVLAWGCAGFGIGLAFPTLSVLALATAEDDRAGEVSSSLQLSDYLANSAGVALGGVLFAGFAATAPVPAATALVVAAAVLGALALVPAARLRG
ncbi:MFS transporter [Pimelobacter simplex]|uniref:MFS transporter n=2 Tax=Nocardioides simplex TaxID=2045 RepID=A0A0A1DI77_NOCSI|nr:MFS transporter [Pimelobacter simplex]AIY17056.1 MFS transporter [Pimelobacter simplex]GEB13012.1 MFS transporter [Pimelobacter simplex]SFM50849.1 Predicted arabinose efflux permease, MFS family [Pimelobacter simplex]